MQEFKKYNIEQIPKSKNSHANALSKLASTYLSQVDRTIYFEINETSNITEGEEVI